MQTRTKVRTRTTTEAIVGGILGPRDAPEALLLGRPDALRRLRIAGRTGPLPVAARHEIGALLASPHGTHPWPQQIPSSRFGQVPSRPVDYIPTEPRLVVEVDADVCWEQNRWRHATTYRRVRLDLHPDDLAGDAVESSA